MISYMVQLRLIILSIYSNHFLPKFAILFAILLIFIYQLEKLYRKKFTRWYQDKHVKGARLVDLNQLNKIVTKQNNGK